LGQGRRVLFAAEDGLTGREYWVSDGTAGGTVPLGEIWPGSYGGAPPLASDTYPRGFAFVPELGLGFLPGNAGTTGGELFPVTTAELGISELQTLGAPCHGTGMPKIAGAGGAPFAGNSAWQLTLAAARAGAPCALFVDPARLDLQVGGCTLFP